MSPTLNLSLFPPAPRIAVMFLIVLVVPARAEVPWPAEPAAQAVNLTGIEGPGQNDFYSDMSGAAWNPLTRRLWVCRNGPGGDASKFWAIRENGSGGYEIDYRNGNRGEWTGFGDLEGITVAHYDEDSVYVIIEGEERIKEYDVSVYGTATLRNNWNTSPYLPLNGGSGAEGIAFVPDEFLAAEGFVDQNGNPYTSQNGMGGLMFVAHQNGGRLYAFDLNRTNGTFTFVGAYQTGYSESADLAFDRSEGLLYIFHGADYNRTEVVTLGSTLVGGERRLNQVVMYGSPMGGNLEGIAVVPNDDCVGGQRAFFLVIDGGGATSLLLFNQFPCCIGDGSYGSDEDGDGVHDCNDDCPNTPPGQPPNADGCSCSQLDSDGDGVNNCNDDCPNTPPGQPPNADGCSCSQLASDGDGVNNCIDDCPNTPPGEAPNAAGCSCSQLGSDCDDDNVCNGTETCTNGECVAGTPLNCDDGIDCTTDTCDPTAGCVHTDNCRFGEVCDQDTGGCVPLPAPEPLPIEPGDTWRYFKGINSAPPADWTTVPFADSGWLSGPGGFGFGPDCMAQRGTTLSDMQNGYLSVYARRLFHVDEPEMISSLTLTVDYDDAFVAYLNGQEVVRRNVTGNPPAHNQPATQDHECSACGGACNAAEVIDLSAFVSLLENGTNVLAIQAHNLSLGSSDFTLTVLLTATLGPNCQLDGDGDGVGDCDDECPDTPAGQPVNGDGCSCNQLDSDGDGVNNCNDDCPNTPPSEAPNADGCSCSQLDSDGDGVNNCNDACPNTPPGEALNADGCSCSQLDSDGDGVNNCNDACPNTPPGPAPNANGCSCSQLDSDGDGVDNCIDACPNTPLGQVPNADGCSCSQLDCDGDGVNDCDDTCPDTPPDSSVNDCGCAVVPTDPDSPVPPDNPGWEPASVPVEGEDEVVAGEVESLDGNGESCAGQDEDADGVDDCEDECPGTAFGAAVDEHGCSCDQSGDCVDGTTAAPVVGLCGAGLVPGAVLSLAGGRAMRRARAARRCLP